MKNMTAIVYFLLIVTVLAGLYLAERFNLNTAAIDTITVIEGQEESVESATSDNPVEPPTYALFDGVYQAVINGQNIDSHPQYALQTQASIHSLIKSVAMRLEQEHEYAALLQLLGTLSGPQRRELGLDFSYASVLAQQGSMDEAIKHYLYLLNYDSSNHSAAINVAILLNRSEQYANSIAALNYAVSNAKQEQQAKALSLMGTAKQGLHLLEAAREHFKQSLQIRPAHAATWLKLAELEQRTYQPFAQVEEAYLKAITLAPDNHIAFYRFGNYLLSQLYFERAKQTLIKALELAPNYAKAQYALAWTLYELGEVQKSLSTWQWVSKHASSGEYRLTARHMISALKNEENRLQQPVLTNDELVYLQATTMIAHNQYSNAVTLLTKIPQESEFSARANNKLEYLRQ